MTLCSGTTLTTSSCSFLVLKRTKNHVRTVYSSRDAPQCTCTVSDAGVTTRRQHLVHTLTTTGLLSVLSCIPQPSAAVATQSTVLRYLSKDELENRILPALKECIPPIKAPLMLRLVFHDAATYRMKSADGGVNGSIQYELERPENFGLKRGVNVIRQLKDRLNTKDGNNNDYSVADLIVLSAAYAVYMTHGPDMFHAVRVGRVDATAEDPVGRMPEETLSAKEQLAVFESMGFSPKEMVALLGSHTIGNKGFGEPLSFDNTYYKSLLKKPWEDKNDKMASMIGLASDRVLPDDEVARSFVETFAESNDEFFKEFEKAFIKLTELGCV
jgi:L-ascorbate peroxidase